MSGATSELAHLFRALKAPAAARAFPALAERAREESWSYEKFLQALLATEVSVRDSHGGENRIKAARFPARKTLEEFDFTFQHSIKKQVIEHLGQLDFLHARENVILLGPPGTGKTHLATALGVRACLAGQRVQFATATAWVARLGDAKRQGQLETELKRLALIPLLVVDEVGYIPFDPEAANLMFALVSSRYERASHDRHQQQAVQRLGRDLRRRRRRHSDDRPAHPPRRHPQPQGRQLPAQRQGPRAPPSTPHLINTPAGISCARLRLAPETPAQQPSSGLVFNRQNRPTFQPTLTEAHLAEIYGVKVGRDLISRVTDAVMDDARAWQTRPLEDVYPVVFLDCMVLKIRDGGSVQRSACYLAMAIGMDGEREVLGMWFQANEGAKFWMQVLTDIKQRGVNDILIACVDGLKGFPEAIEAVFPATTVQTCIVHYADARVMPRLPRRGCNRVGLGSLRSA